MQKIIAQYFLTNHATFESVRKNYYTTSWLINIKANERALKQTHKFLDKNLKNGCNKQDISFLCCGTWLTCLPWCLEPTRKWKLVCLFEANNLFDMFAIRACRKDCEKTVGHLPREISSPTKYLIDRVAKITAKLSSIHYRRSPLFQGGLEIPCKVTVTIPASTKGHLLMQHYEKYGTWTLLWT